MNTGTDATAILGTGADDNEYGGDLTLTVHLTELMLQVQRCCR